MSTQAIDRRFWSEDVTITPDVAKMWKREYLHPHQRPLRLWWVKQLSQYVSTGQFVPSTLRLVHIDGTTFLNDGQHRIEAVIAANKPADFTVQHINGQSIEDAMRDYSCVDRGVPRSHKDAMRIYDVEGRYNLSGAQVERANSGLTYIIRGFDRTGTEGRMATRDSSLRVLYLKEWIYEIKEYYGIIHECKPALSKRFYNATLMAVAWITLRHQNLQAVQFWSTLMRDEGLKRSDPQKALWRFMLNSDGQNARNEGHHHYYATAWNKFFTGEPCTLLKVLPPYSKPVEILGTPYTSKSYHQCKLSPDLDPAAAE